MEYAPLRIGDDMYVVNDFRDDYALIREWGQVCRREFIWHPEWGRASHVVSAKHPTMEAADAQARQMALSSGYYPPKWFEFWRWNEKPLPGLTPHAVH